MIKETIEEYIKFVKELDIRIHSLETQKENIKVEFFNRYNKLNYRVYSLTKIYNDMISIVRRHKKGKVIQINIPKKKVCACIGAACPICQKIFTSCKGLEKVEGQYYHKECR